MTVFLQGARICDTGNGMPRKRNGHDLTREGRLVVMLAKIANGAAVPMPSTDREAIVAIDSGYGDYRRVYCRFYDRCLDYAADAKWLGFTCRACTVDEPIDDEAHKIENRAVVRRISLMDLGGTADRRRG